MGNTTVCTVLKLDSMNSHYFFSYLSSVIDYCLFVSDVRVAALEALVEVARADARLDDWEFIIDIIEKDPEPRVRHKLLLLLAKNPPFEKGRGSRLDTIEIADRFWRLMK